VTRVLPFAAAAIAGALALALCLALLGGSDAATPAQAQQTWKAPDGSFSIVTPDGWKAVASGAEATVLQRTDKRGVVVIRERAAVTGSFDRLARRLERTLRARIGDFRPAGAKVAQVGDGEGLVYTFVRPAANQVQSVVVAPAGHRSYTLDLVADGDAPDVARELAGMVRSFSPQR
jgi:hypothetical protein